MLERATSHFRCGYRACRRNAGLLASLSANPYTPGTFAWADWHEGYLAALAEFKRAKANVDRAIDLDNFNHREFS
jgi:hypothetical protein